ncbi:MAG: six-hairpin glycosidase, partial [Bacteroidales bacterium]
GIPPDSNMWVTYSMNKEDIWVAKIPVPVKSIVEEDVCEVFNEMKQGEELLHWNIHSPLWAPVKTEKLPDGTKALSLSDKDRYEYAKAERVFPSSQKGTVEFTFIPAQNNRGVFHIELHDEKGTAALRLVFDSLGNCSIKDGYRYSGVFNYKPGEVYNIIISFDSKTQFYKVNVNGEDKKQAMFFAPVKSLQRIVFRTGEPRRYPDPESPAEHTEDMPLSGEPVEKAAYYIKNVKTTRE